MQQTYDERSANKTERTSIYSIDLNVTKSRVKADTGQTL